MSSVNYTISAFYSAVNDVDCMSLKVLLMLNPSGITDILSDRHGSPFMSAIDRGYTQVKEPHF